MFFPSQTKVLQSSGIALFGQGISLLLTFLASVLIARGLGETAFGQFTFLISLLNFIALIPDFGLNWTLQRELARNGYGANVTGSAFVSRFLLFLVALAALNGFFYVSSLEEGLWLPANIIALNIILSARMSGLRIVLESPYRSDMQLLVPIGLGFLDTLLLMALLTTFPHLASNLNDVVFTYTLSNVPGFLVLFFLLRRRGKITLRTRLVDMKSLLVASIPLALYSALSALHNTFDVFLLKGFWENQTVGQYGVAIRFFQPFVFIPNAFVMGTYPIFSRWFVEEPERLQEGIRLGLKLMLCVGLSISVTMILFSESLFHELFHDEYRDSIVLLQVLSLAHIFWFVQLFGSSVVTATNKQKETFWIATSIVVVDLLLNTVAIPRLGGLGAAATRVCAEFVGMVVTISLLRRYLDSAFWIGSAKLVLGVGIAFVVAMLADVPNPFLTLALVLAVFGVFGLFLKPVTVDELRRMRMFLSSSLRTT